MKCPLLESDKYAGKYSVNFLSIHATLMLFMVSQHIHKNENLSIKIVQENPVNSLL